jgi:hypothetical protein
LPYYLVIYLALLYEGSLLHRPLIILNIAFPLLEKFRNKNFLFSELTLGVVLKKENLIKNRGKLK